MPISASVTAAARGRWKKLRGKGKAMKKAIIEWLVERYLPEYHLVKIRKRKGEKKDE